MTGWRRRWYDIVFRHDTRRSRNFDLLLIVAILTSVMVIMLDSVALPASRTVVAVRDRLKHGVSAVCAPAAIR